MTDQTELFLETSRYYLLVRCLRQALRRTYKHADERGYAAHANLSLAGIYLGELRMVDRKVVAEFYSDLVDALAAVQPCAVSGKIEDNEIIAVLGDAGNIWPAVIQADLSLDTEGCNTL
ncbi:hypothetical protein X727_14855 [Mesorhizobium sp. L103C119B0]|uniref:hypothetical protein n=1 Tax=Mesorhizobium sp. L103C119B0 TaxID=1287085 RepID=UPI0003D02246|nr:hypothetical protein [Mesorhizobium sp. L103C119B0]ESZ69995.1 hypothetical protein X727_14855 [Mesorhizobium sp. L103C119B0]